MKLQTDLQVKSSSGGYIVSVTTIYVSVHPCVSELFCLPGILCVLSGVFVSILSVSLQPFQPARSSACMGAFVSFCLRFYLSDGWSKTEARVLCCLNGVSEFMATI